LTKKIQYNLSLGLREGVLATGEAFCPQKKASSISKHEIYSLFPFFVAIFALPDPDPSYQNQCVSGCTKITRRKNFAARW
jgi:hypothetical protein